MTGAIFYRKRERGMERLELLIKEYEEKGIFPINERMGGAGIFVLFDNGDLWKVLLANPTVRGNKFNKVLVDRQIDEEFISTCVLPNLVLPSGGEYDYY